jgi:hypothetical protein
VNSLLVLQAHSNVMVTVTTCVRSTVRLFKAMQACLIIQTAGIRSVKLRGPIIVDESAIYV